MGIEGAGWVVRPGAPATHCAQGAYHDGSMAYVMICTVQHKRREAPMLRGAVCPILWAGCKALVGGAIRRKQARSP